MRREAVIYSRYVGCGSWIVMTVHQLLWLQTASAPANQMKWRHLIGDLNSYVRFVDLKRSLACDLPALTRSFKWSESRIPLLA